MACVHVCWAPQRKKKKKKKNIKIVKDREKKSYSQYLAHAD